MNTLSLRAITKKLIMTLAFSVLVLQMLTAVPVSAAGASLYISASATSVTKGQIVTVNFRVNPNGENIDAVTVNATYDASKLTPKSATLTAGYFNIATDNVVGSGNVTFTAANFTATTSDQLIGSVQFSADVVGTAEILYQVSSFASQTGTGNDVTSSRTGITIAVNEPAAAPAPAPSDSATTTAPATETTVEPALNEVSIQGETEGNPKVLVKTNIATTVEVKYGITTDQLFLNAVSTSKLEHEITLSVAGLSSGATVYYQVTATNADGTSINSAVKSFVLTLPNEQDNVVSSLIVRVINGNDPVVGALVSLGDDQQVTTNSSGDARFNILEAGEYELIVTSNGKTIKQTIMLNIDEQIQNVEVQLASSLGDIFRAIGVIIGLVAVGVAVYALKKFIFKPSFKYASESASPQVPSASIKSSAPAPTVINPGSDQKPKKAPPVIKATPKVAPKSQVDTANKTIEQIEQQIGVKKRN